MCESRKSVVSFKEMSSKSKIRVAVLYGGRSGEHEVSLRSAASVIKYLDANRFEIIPVSIDKSGQWRINDLKVLQSAGAVLPVYDNPTDFSKNVMLLAKPGSKGDQQGQLISTHGGGGITLAKVDVVFPVMHGPLCEDGTIQGLFEIADIPYVGCGVMSSAVCMDKDVAKRLIRDAGISMVPYVCVQKSRVIKDAQKISDQVKNELGYPCFVKPSNMGSSVGVHKVKSPDQLQAALLDSFKYDTKVLIEKAIDAREIEFSVLENIKEGEEPLVSIAGEIIPQHEFYSYDAKYIDENGASYKIPAPITSQQMKEGTEIARRAFNVLGCEGMARVDLFLDKTSGKLYFNEVNTLPGFTSISMYPKMWEASGLPYSELLTKLIELALARYAVKQKISREYLPD